MFIKKFIAILLLLVYASGSIACSTFFLYYNGQMVFGRNYDWMTGSGMACTNLRGLAKTSAKNDDGGTISWVSRYGSISFNQYGKEFPTGGMNEKGLVVELMWLDGTAYPKADARPAVDVLQWIQYQLDNNATIEEVIASDKLLRIGSHDVPLHYLVADANGHATSIEFMNGKMKVHTGKDLPQPVLTNDTYDKSLLSHVNRTAKGNNSLERFSTACKMIQQYKADPAGRSLVDQSFAILDKVAQGDYTKWSIVYDITAKKIWFKTGKFPQLRSIDFSAFDFSCTGTAKQININGNEKGDISHLFTGYSPAMNRAIVEKSLEQSSPQVVVTPEQKEGILAYPGTIHCK